MKVELHKSAPKNRVAELWQEHRQYTAETALDLIHFPVGLRTTAQDGSQCRLLSGKIHRLRSVGSEGELYHGHQTSTEADWWECRDPQYRMQLTDQVVRVGWRYLSQQLEGHRMLTSECLFQSNETYTLTDCGRGKRSCSSRYATSWRQTSLSTTLNINVRVQLTWREFKRQCPFMGFWIPAR